MAYRRRRTYRRKARRPVFGQRATQAIKRIAQQPVETKHMDENWTWNSLLVNAGYTSGATAMVRGSVHNHIPRENNSITKSEHTFIGNEIHMRGFRWEFMGYLSGAVALPDVKFRFTVYDDPLAQTVFPLTVTSSSHVWDPDFAVIPTWSRWNAQAVKIRYQRMFTLGSSSTGSSNIRKKFYIPIRRKLTALTEESVTVNQFFGVAKEDQIYWILEVLGPDLGDLSTQIVGYVNTTVYFKDE